MNQENILEKQILIFVVYTMIITMLISCNSSPLKTEWIPINIDFKTIKDSYKFSDEIVDINDQELKAYYYSNIGNENKAIENYDVDCTEDRSPPIDANLILENHQFAPAVSTILSKAEEVDIVIINECHHIPSHRDFTRSLLKDMYRIGYRYIGLEALDLNYFNYFDSSSEGFPHYYHGLLMEQPNLSRIAREAIQIGFKVFAYERNSSKGEQREEDQANEIVNFINATGNGKLLIHCGYNHAREGKLDDYMKESMAEKLKQKLNTEVLTVDQTMFRERGNVLCESSLYRKFQENSVSVLVPINDQTSFMDSDTAWMDLYVFHPKGNSRQTIQDETIEVSVAGLNLPSIIRMYSDTTNLANRVPDYVAEVTKINNKIEVPIQVSILIAEDMNHIKKITTLK